MSTSKDHIDHWKSRLRKQKLSPRSWEGEGKNQDWEIYLQHRGVREWFNLRTPNKDAAAVKARDVWRVVVGAGWEAARSQFKPSVVRTLKSPTLGEYLTLVRTHSTLRDFTVEVYARKLRTLVAEMRGLEFLSDDGGHDGWRERVESTKLSAITVCAVQEWKKARVRAAGDSPVLTQQTRRTINSILRNAKSLFSPKLLKILPVTIEEPVPFKDVDFEKAHRVRYRSKVNVRNLLERAELDLRFQNLEAYKVFLLALTAGLRRNEIDGLTWRQIDFEQATIRIETTAHTELKSEDSEDAVDIPKPVAQKLKQLRESSLSEFVISAPPKKASQARNPTYRCDVAFEFLIGWLRGQGVDDKKPIHLLRKEFGSFIASEYGIFAASSALRHANINTTRTYYVDKKKRAVFDPALAS